MLNTEVRRESGISDTNLFGYFEKEYRGASSMFLEGFNLSGVYLVAFTILITSLVLVLMRYLKIPLCPPSSLGESVERTPHFVVQDGEEVSLPRMRKMYWIDKISKTSGTVKAICGECKDTDTVKKALAMNTPVEIICGPKMWNDKTKEDFINMMKDPSNDLRIYILPHRPLRHATRIGNNLLLEDPHEELEEYNSAILIENAQKMLLSNYDDIFEKLKQNLKLATISDIEMMKTYKTNEA